MIGLIFVCAFLAAVFALSLPRLVAYRFAGREFLALCWSDDSGSLAWHFQDLRELGALVRNLSRL